MTLMFFFSLTHAKISLFLFLFFSLYYSSKSVMFVSIVIPPQYLNPSGPRYP